MTLRLLIATLALAALPASAHAATVELQPDGTLRFSARAHEANDVRVYADGPSGIHVFDVGGAPKPVGTGCVQYGEEGVSCPTGVARVELMLGDRDDAYSGRHALPTILDAGPGDDAYDLDEEIGAVTSRTDFHGGAGHDHVSYARATSAVTVSKDDVANDGRAGDGDNIHSDVEELQGSGFADTLTGNPHRGTRFYGADGNDIMIGIGGENVFEAADYRDGADVIRGGTGLDEVDYTARRHALNVSVDSGMHDDGARDEGDDVADVEIVDGGGGPDTLSGSAPLEAYGGGGDDTLIGSPGADYLDGEIGEDTVVGGPGPDTIHAADATRDHAECGGDDGDWIWRDKHERSVTGCDTAGMLDLHAERRSVRLVWTHTGGWRKLRRLAITPWQGGRNHGEIRIDPKRKRLTAVGVKLHGRGVVTRSGDRVTARFEYRIDDYTSGRVHYRADAIETE